MTWQHRFNSLFTDSFFRFLFGFTVIIAASFGVVITTDLLFGNPPQDIQTAAIGSQ